MKKIDLHMHTKASLSDAPFDFCLDKLKEYVDKARLDGIAITNHNLFDAEQFHSIKQAIAIPVFPGIEIDLEKCHLLLISDGLRLEEFEAKALKVSTKITTPNDCISVDELQEIFGNLDDYLIIPHYDKKPAIQKDTLSKLVNYISAGEVDSAKKFLRVTKDTNGLTPVLFSDTRISDSLETFPIRHTFIDCGELTLSAIKTCLRDKGKVVLSEKDGNKLFQVLEDGQMLSTGLNVLLGERSSGKTYTLDRISCEHENSKYIRQFSLVQQDETNYNKQFNNDVENRRSRFSDEYLRGFKTVLEDIMNVDLTKNEKDVEEYVSTLLTSAEEAGRRDVFSRSTLFNESAFALSDDKTLKDLIESVRQVIENIDHRDIIEKHLDIAAVKRLACELIARLWARSLETKKKQMVNELVRDVKQQLRTKSSAIQIYDVDLYKIVIEASKVKRFEEIAKGVKKEAVIFKESVQGFRVVATKGPFKGAGELKDASGKKTVFKDAMKVYNSPYKYLKILMSKDILTDSELYRLFTKISYQILNKDGFPVSGGERSEFRLLQEIKNAQNYDLLLIDEPESSFDNIFLHSDVNEILRQISKSMPVIVVTHNSTVGASLKADYLLYASKTTEGKNVRYGIHSGYPTDKMLLSNDGSSIASHQILMDSLEAGNQAYDQRRRDYEAVKN